MVFSKFLDMILHLDKYVAILTQSYGVWMYGILFLVIFLETGLVFFPFLPGDSLLFVVGSFAAQDSFNIFLLIILLSMASIVGDSLNYWIGHSFGTYLFQRAWIKQHYIQHTEEFYQKHGKKTIILARFIPIIRTFAPFIAGIGKMHYPVFFLYNIIGGLLWVTLFLLLGYFFGQLSYVQEHFGLFVAGIIVLSLIPLVKEVYHQVRKK